ncbi:hypothetical protein EJ04DRAFT_503744 [Polyplosphaeria fusca]|uniref:BTB domain-containing protein n=1 Tax=Polyplosphaeria fusca TaxID=682080 RepID=A0A9P4QJX5_9PLEO|nr:hypothetical protein EJ04DRAFT_503744 [Polyplosphaeria fusca]
MATTVHEVVPDPDTVIILNNPTTLFAVWKHHVADSKTKEEDEGDEDGPTLIDVSDSECGSIHYHVSSRHLALASPWFNRAMSGDSWKESDRDEEGRFHIETSGWDADALLLLLNVLHLKNSQVPDTVDLEMLAKIAVLMDYYECSEALQLCTKMWVQALGEASKVPNVMGRELIIWLFVAWTFGMHDQFQSACDTAIKEGFGELDTLELPIPAAVTAVNDTRVKLISEISDGLFALFNKFQSAEYVCLLSNKSFECGCILLGALTRGLDAIGVLNTDAPFDGISVSGLCDSARAMRSPVWFCSASASGYQRTKHPCGLQTPVNDVLSKAGKDLLRPKLDDFKKKQTDGLKGLS